MNHKCKYCRAVKPESEFPDNNKSKCRECYNEYQNKRRGLKKKRHDTPRQPINFQSVSKFEREMREWEIEEHKKHCTSCKHFHTTRAMKKNGETFIFGWCNCIKQRTPFVGNKREICSYYENK